MAKAGLNQANIAYNGYKIGKKYDQLVDDPFQGNGTDVVARMKNHNGEPVVLQREEAIQGPNGRVITSGKYFKRATSTERNYGLDKGIYKHEVSRADAQRIPRIIQILSLQCTILQNKTEGSHARAFFLFFLYLKLYSKQRYTTGD